MADAIWERVLATDVARGHVGIGGAPEARDSVRRTLFRLRCSADRDEIGNTIGNTHENWIY